jgi:hypothetical protein
MSTGFGNPKKVISQRIAPSAKNQNSSEAQKE